MIDELGWASLESRKMRVQMLYKILKNIVSPGPTPIIWNMLIPVHYYLFEFCTVTNISITTESPHYDLRGYHTQIYPLHCWTDTFKNSFFPETIELWNNYSLKLLHHLHLLFLHTNHLHCRVPFKLVIIVTAYLYYLLCEVLHSQITKLQNL